jgi:hypothetical protein
VAISEDELDVKNTLSAAVDVITVKLASRDLTV